MRRQRIHSFAIKQIEEYFNISILCQRWSNEFKASILTEDVLVSFYGE